MGNRRKTLGLAVGASLAASLRLKNVGLSKVGRMLAEALDSLDVGASAAWAISVGASVWPLACV